MFAYTVCHGLQHDSRISTGRRRLILLIIEKSAELQLLLLSSFVSLSYFRIERICFDVAVSPHNIKHVSRL